MTSDKQPTVMSVMNMVSAREMSSLLKFWNIITWNQLNDTQCRWRCFSLFVYTFEPKLKLLLLLLPLPQLSWYSVFSRFWSHILFTGSTQALCLCYFRRCWLHTNTLVKTGKMLPNFLKSFEPWPYGPLAEPKKRHWQYQKLDVAFRLWF